MEDLFLLESYWVYIKAVSYKNKDSDQLRNHYFYLCFTQLHNQNSFLALTSYYFL